MIKGEVEVEAWAAMADEADEVDAIRYGKHNCDGNADYGGNDGSDGKGGDNEHGYGRNTDDGDEVEAGDGAANQVDAVEAGDGAAAAQKWKELIINKNKIRLPFSCAGVCYVTGSLYKNRAVK